MFGGMGRMALKPAARDDGRDRQPAVLARFWTNRFNNLPRRDYVVPRRIRNMPLRFPPRAGRQPDLLHRGDERAARALDPAIQRPGRMGRHVWFRTPTKHDREDIFNLYLGKVTTIPSSTPSGPATSSPDHQRLLAGDGRAGLLDGADPRPPRRARRVQPRGHHRGDDDRRVGTAVGVEYVPEETRAVAIHEAATRRRRTCS
jgi:hypothetical protein